MKLCIKLWILIFMNPVLAACVIGNGHICGPQTPLAYCDKEAYEKLLHPTPQLHYWQKPGMTEEGRREDSFNCGGLREDSQPSLSPKEESLRRPNETIWQTRERLHIVWTNCMKAKGYRRVNSQQ